jgi:hypothetical protein
LLVPPLVFIPILDVEEEEVMEAAIRITRE